VYQIEVAFDRSVGRAERPTLASLLEAAARAALAHQNHRECELTILVTDDDRMAALNRAHRGIPDSTDVLSFPTGESVAIPDGPDYLGDIAISLPRASQQAAAGGHSVEQELQLLVVHGTLHLLGHDHGEPDDKARMWAAQSSILDSLGVALTVGD
jgi:probable rRNA maturation factor